MQYTKSFTLPTERRQFAAHGFMDILTLESGAMVGHGFFEPGWRWSQDVKPIASTASCSVEHVGFCTRGSMLVRLDNGDEFTIKAGEVFQIPAGHDAWVSDSDGCEMYDFAGAVHYAEDLREQQARTEMIQQEAAE